MSISPTKPDSKYLNIFGNITEQKETILIFVQINMAMLHIMKHLLPRGNCGPGPCKFDITASDYAADVVLNCSNISL